MNKFWNIYGGAVWIGIALHGAFLTGILYDRGGPWKMVGALSLFYVFATWCWFKK